MSIESRKSLQTIKQSTDVESFLDYRIDNAVGPICMQLWLGLARTELRGEPKGIETDEVQSISLHQQALVDIAMGASGTREASILVDEDSYEKQKILFDLERRDLVEYESNWHVFSEVMRCFVLKQVPLLTSIVMRSQVSSKSAKRNAWINLSGEEGGMITFTCIEASSVLEKISCGLSGQIKNQPIARFRKLSNVYERRLSLTLKIPAIL